MEAIFKATALDQATMLEERLAGKVLSTRARYKASQVLSVHISMQSDQQSETASPLQRVMALSSVAVPSDHRRTMNASGAGSFGEPVLLFISRLRYGYELGVAGEARLRVAHDCDY